MSYSLAHPLSERRGLNLKTWQLFLLVLIANIALMLLYNEFILTLDVYHNILSEQMESTRIDEYFDTFRKVSQWGYVAQPILLLIQITFIALLIQMPLVLVFIDIPFAYLFRLVAWASLLMTAGGFVRFLWLFNLEAFEIYKNILNMMPFSINHLLDASVYPETAYMILGKFSVFELFWCFVLYNGLISTGKIKKEYAALLIFSMWAALLLFQWGLVAYFQGANA